MFKQEQGSQLSQQGIHERSVAATSYTTKLSSSFKASSTSSLNSNNKQYKKSHNKLMTIIRIHAGG